MLQKMYKSFNIFEHVLHTGDLLMSEVLNTALIESALYCLRGTSYELFPST